MGSSPSRLLVCTPAPYGKQGWDDGLNAMTDLFSYKKHITSKWQHIFNNYIHFLFSSKSTDLAPLQFKELEAHSLPAAK